MKAYVLHDVNDIRLEEADMPLPEPNEVIVEIKACGVCGSDIPRIYENGAHRMPLIPGHEFSGIVKGVGNKAHPSWIGKRVGVFPLVPCMKCEQCKTGKYEMCRNYRYLGSRADGAFAEYVSVPVDNLISLPEEVTYEAAAMLEPMSVAIHAIRQAKLYRDSRITVCGLGAIGQLVVMILMGMGYKEIYAIGKNEAQKGRAVESGLKADRYCNSCDTDARKWLTEHTDGIDVFFECVGSNETVNLAIECTSPGGHIVVVGNPYTDMILPRETYWRILRNQLTIHGTWNSSFTQKQDDDWHIALSMIQEGKVAPERLITHRFPIDELEKGFRIMREKTEDYCKVMMTLI